MQKTALIVGATGIVGGNLGRHLVGQNWNVIGLSRRTDGLPAGVEPLTADLHDKDSLASKLKHVKPTHVFFGSWSRQATEAENIAVNSAMVRNMLDATSPAGTVEHVALVTGLKHYLGPFEMYAKGTPAPTPFRESEPRLDVPNFYYAQEDEIFAAAKRDGFGWSVHRPHTMIGFALGNIMNLGVTLAIYASLCKATGRPFVFPGSAAQWNGLTDMTDATQLARHLEWASTTPAARNQALNIVNGDVFRWKWMWGRIADWFGIEAAPFPERTTPLEEQMADAKLFWANIATDHDLVEKDIDRLASPWHTDADLGRPFECVTDMSKSRDLGFTHFKSTDRAMFDLFERLRAERVIPNN